MHFNKTVQKSLGSKQKGKVLKHSKCLATEQNKCETVVGRTDTERDRTDHEYWSTQVLVLSSATDTSQNLTN